jgi:hypothetical protein
VEAWTNDRHISLENIYELRQFVRIGAVHEPADAHHTRIIGSSMAGVGINPHNS